MRVSERPGENRSDQSRVVICERAAEDAIEICEEYGSKAVCARPKPSCDSDIMG